MPDASKRCLLKLHSKFHALQANSWQQTCKGPAHGRAYAWRAVSRQCEPIFRLHHAATAKPPVQQRAAVLVNAAISGTALAVEHPMTQQRTAANNVVAPEALHYGGYDQPINESLSYMKSLTIRCVPASFYNTNLTATIPVAFWVFLLACQKACRCRNFALVEEQHVAFRPGLNVITGESGAGKSVLVEAFGQVCLHAKPISLLPLHAISENILSCVMLQRNMREYRTSFQLCTYLQEIAMANLLHHRQGPFAS